MDDELYKIANQFAQLNIKEQALLRRREDLTLRLQQARQRKEQEARRARAAIAKAVTNDIRVGDQVYITSTVQLPAGQNRAVVDKDRNGRVIEITGERIWIDTDNNN